VPLLHEAYATQKGTWPASGRHILAQYDDRTVVVYQAYLPEIAAYAVEHQRLGGPGFSFTRMSWVKPNFLWMMFRSGWGTKPGQEATLAVRIMRKAFDVVLAAAVPSTFTPATFESEAQWKAALARSSVRLQWDPDHDPAGRPLERRAIQLGLRGEVLRQSEHLDLTTPRERVYPVSDSQTARVLGL
jgi:hypothetical protein